MLNFTISEPLFPVPCNGNTQEKAELDAFIRLLEEFGAFCVIEQYDVERPSVAQFVLLMSEAGVLETNDIKQRTCLLG